MRLSKLGEFGLIKKLQKKIPAISPDVITGIGDDAAAIKVPKSRILVTSDMLIEGVHFDLSFTTFYQLGHKFLAVNISDILAMGGEPKYFLVSIGIPEKCDSENINELYSGISAIARKFGISIIGGDTCASKNGLILNGTLIGNVKHRTINRSGAKAGDGIFITDTAGDSAMGLFLLLNLKQKIKRCESEKAGIKFQGISLECRNVLSLVKKHLMPQPVHLKNTHRVTSMIDISDGLLADLGHICDESRTGAVIYKEKIPLSGELLSVAKKLGRDPLDFALKGGEDYILLFTAPVSYRTNAYRIGEIIKKGRYIIDSNGRKSRFKAEGYEHFKNSE
ncbi:MAG: thiamine-phosphate kinase [Nitrospiraceae bacterium]|nr:MAG: thiamine-phosphate kinase [Nitrospiraceae bacterium]